MDELLKVVDRAGQVGMGRVGIPGLALAVHLPVDVVQPGLDGLLEDGCVTQVGQVLTIENFVEAQAAATSDKTRQQNLRDRRKSLKSRNTPVTRSHEPSRDVTNRREESRGDKSRGEEKTRSADAEPASQLQLTPPVPVVRPEVPALFAYWAQKLNHPRAILDEDRRTLLLDRFREGMTLEEGKLVVDGALVDIQAWPDRKKFDGIEYLFRDRSWVEKLSAMAGTVPTRPKGGYDVSTQNHEPVAPGQFRREVLK
jgi:hypothetical protein